MCDCNNASRKVFWENVANAVYLVVLCTALAAGVVAMFGGR